MHLRHTRNLSVNRGPDDAELRRRHPEQRFTPLRSAESTAATDTQRPDLTLTAGQDTSHAGQWIKDLTASRRTFAGRLAERQSLMVPSENPDYGDLGVCGIVPGSFQPGREPDDRICADRLLAVGLAPAVVTANTLVEVPGPDLAGAGG
jgi:hypothetical protein